MPRYIEENEIYNLFNARGVAQLHVGDIDVLPRAEVKPIVRAKWVVELDDMGWKKHTCTNCQYFRRTDIHVSLNWEHCPHCGAEMSK